MNPKDEFSEKLYEDHIKEIKDEIEKYPIISEVKDLNKLENEFNNNEVFIDKLNQIKITHNKFRQLRKDGSCFYRAYIFNLFEFMINNKNNEIYNKFLKKFEDMKDFLVNAGFDLIVFEDYLEFMIEKIKEFKNIKDLENFYSNIENCNSIMMIIRFVTSSYLKYNKIIYINYFESEIEFNKFLNHEVENIESEADQFQIMALNSYFDFIKLNIYYIDNNEGKINILSLPEDDTPKDLDIDLVYRPGHYDLLYKNNN